MKKQRQKVNVKPNRSSQLASSSRRSDSAIGIGCSCTHQGGQIFYDPHICQIFEDDISIFWGIKSNQKHQILTKKKTRKNKFTKKSYQKKNKPKPLGLYKNRIIQFLYKKKQSGHSGTHTPVRFVNVFTASP